MKILVGKKNIEKFCQRNFDRTILPWIRTQGFPARKLDGVWHSDEDLIITWFRRRITGAENPSPAAFSDLP
jgi:hypothetical protein